MQIQVYLTPKFTLRPQQTQGIMSNMFGGKGKCIGEKLGQGLEHFPHIPTALSHFAS